MSASAGADRATRQNGRIVFAAAGEDQAQLLTLHLGSRRSRVVRGFEGAAALTLSPSGRYVAFVRNAQQRSQTVLVARSDGSHRYKLGVGCGPTWSPTGDQLAFVSGENGWCFGSTLAVVKRDGSGFEPIYTGFVGLPQWSPDGSWIAFVRHRESPDWIDDLFAVRPDGSDEHLVVSDILLNGYDWSPDGRRLVFVKDTQGPGGFQPDLFSVAVGGGATTRVTDDPIYKEDPEWSPDGSLIAYSTVPSNGVGGFEVVVIGSSGSGQHAVGDGAVPRWSRNGRLAYLSPEGIALANPDGSASSLIFRQAMGASFDDLGWFPSGTRLLFSRRVQDSRSDLFRISRGKTRRILPRVRALEPSWSRSGQYLAFVRVGAAGNHELAVVRRNGSGLRALTRNPYGWDSQPTWAPDGRRTAFVRVYSWDSWAERALYVRNVASGPVRRLSDAVAPDHPAWSPDGRVIAVDGMRNDLEHRGIRLVDVATGAVEDLTHPRYGYDRIAAWSPDGQRLAFVRRYSGGSVGSQEVWVVTIAGGEEHRIASDLGPDPLQAYYLCWSPDGQRIAAAGQLGSDWGGLPAVVTMRPDGSDRRVVWRKDRYVTGLAWEPR